MALQLALIGAANALIGSPMAVRPALVPVAALRIGAVSLIDVSTPSAVVEMSRTTAPATSVHLRKESHLMPGPIMLSWAAAVLTIALQVTLTDGSKVAQDAELFWGFIGDQLPGGVMWQAFQQDTAAPQLALYAFIWVNVVGACFFLMPFSFPVQRSEPDQNGHRAELEVPRRSHDMAQHQINAIDLSYIVLNTLCMPGFFYHFFCLLRSWGFDPAAPLVAVDSAGAWGQLGLQTVEAFGSLAVYFFVFEFFYYHWHRAMHKVPTLYKRVHKHHHQQTYPDRPALDTLNTGCVESQVGLYMQLAILWSCGHFFGVANLPAATMFITLAGWLSVLEHDKFERALPFDLWKADEHHMYHAYVRCNYSPYSTFWDKVFGTFKAHEVKRYMLDKQTLEGDPQRDFQRTSSTAITTKAPSDGERDE